jgi:hypothetical protein
VRFIRGAGGSTDVASVRSVRVVTATHARGGRTSHEALPLATSAAGTRRPPRP